MHKNLFLPKVRDNFIIIVDIEIFKRLGHDQPLCIIGILLLVYI